MKNKMESRIMGTMDSEYIDTISKDAGAEDEDMQKDIRERAQGNPGASNVLGQLSSRGAEVYNAVAHNLGNGSEIYSKYSDECKKNLDILIEKYSEKVAEKE
jgi:hypothetical protein